MIGGYTKGDAALASSSIAVTVLMLSILPALGIAQAVSIRLGQHLGENRPDLAEQTSWTGLEMSLALMLSFGISFLLFPGFSFELV